MLSSGAYDFVDIMTKAADASWLREEVISNNIANVDTPNFKRKDVAFSTYLSAALNEGDEKNLRQRIKNFKEDSVEPLVYTDHRNLSYRLDGNNVDIDTENVELASEQIKYNGLIESISKEFSMLKNAMQTR
ncbi:MAG: flagellar basal body rod protein FlgB [Lachnospiraceae bacterium]|nr:flagellar basal body rod protein FlgB [Lachnospiraceae bacterium]